MNDDQQCAAELKGPLGPSSKADHKHQSHPLKSMNCSQLRSRTVVHSSENGLRVQVVKDDQQCDTELKGPLSPTVPCESLVSREFSRIFFQFHFSISISGHFHFTFHSRSRFQGIFISLFTLGKSESISNFTLFSREKRVKYAFLVNEGQCEADERI